MNTFLKLADVKLNAANYLVTVNGDKPVYHTAFVVQQEEAAVVVLTAEAIKGKTFKASKVDSLSAIMSEVRRNLNATSAVSYITIPTKPVGDLTSKLADEAMAFVNFDKSKAKAEELNSAMQAFNAINAIETTGDYFYENLVKLTKIYTIAEVKAAMEAIQAAE